MAPVKLPESTCPTAVNLTYLKGGFPSRRASRPDGL